MFITSEVKLLHCCLTTHTHTQLPKLHTHTHTHTHTYTYTAAMKMTFTTSSNHTGDDSISIAILRTLSVKSRMNKHAIMGILCLSFSLSLRARILPLGERRDRCSIGEVRASPCSLLIICCSVSKSCPTLCDSMDCSTPSFPVLHYLPEFAQTPVHWVGDATQPSYSLSSPSPPALNLSQHQSLFQWVNSSQQVAKVLELQLHHQSFQWIFRVDSL